MKGGLDTLVLRLTNAVICLRLLLRRERAGG